MAEHTFQQSNDETSDPKDDRSSHQHPSNFKACERRTTYTPVLARPTPRDARASIPQETEKGEPCSTESDITRRVNGLETQNRRMQIMLLTAYVLFGYVLYLELAPKQVVVQETRTQSKEVLLVDNSGVARMSLRMYSDRPILQLLDGNGTARLSLGMRFDDAPFIDLSDKSGRTRATFNMSEFDEPAIRLYDENGDPRFALN